LHGRDLANLIVGILTWANLVLRPCHYWPGSRAGGKYYKFATLHFRPRTLEGIVAVQLRLLEGLAVIHTRLGRRLTWRPRRALIASMPRKAATQRLPLVEPIIRPTFRRERRHINNGVFPVAGCDEAGRGPLAGPVVAAAVILDPARIPRGLNDSKKLDAEDREALYEKIYASAQVAVAFGSVARVDRDNILRASLWALARAVKALPVRPRMVFVDGNMKIDCGCDCQAVVSGDALIASIAAASIVAKVTRDRLMKRLGLAHPGYGFERHMGYSVPEHFAALARLGPTIHHRRSFAPVAARLAALGVISDEVIAELLPL
jgi:ribonuclease HII